MYYICKARRFMNDLCAQLFNLYQITYMYAPYFEESLVLELAYHLRDGISRSFHGDLHGNYSGFLRVYRVFPGFSELRDPGTPIVYPRLVNFNSKMVFCLVCCPRDHLNWSQIGCANSARYLKGTCSRLDSCNFLYLKAASEHSILQAFGCDPKGPRWPKMALGSLP